MATELDLEKQLNCHWYKWVGEYPPKSLEYKALVICVSNFSPGIRTEEMDQKILKMEGFPDVI